MDNKLIRQYGEEILCYRLRTRRAKKRAQYEDFHKRLIQINKEESSLSRQKWNLGWEPLDPPVQKGWKRTFVLREDVKRSKNAEFYVGILAKINTVQWDHRKDFLKKKRAFGRKKYVSREQYLLKPAEHHFQKLRFSEAEKQQFHAEYHYEPGRGHFVKRYVFNESWRFVLKVQPNMIDKTRRIDSEIEARLEEIDAYLEGNAYKGTLIRLLQGNNKWGWKPELKYNESNPLKNKPLTTILDELKGQL